MDVGRVFGNLNQKFAAKFRDKLNELWTSKFCKDGLLEDSKEAADIVERCGRIKPSHQLVTTWYEKQFGVKYQEMRQLFN